MEDDLVNQLEATGNYRVIKRFVPVDRYHPADDLKPKIGIYLDVETTGMDAESDKIIELAMVPFEFLSSGKIYRVLPAYTSFQYPGIPIPPEITKITGITDEMVTGSSIDLDQVAALLSDAVIVIAHNARFDRPFMEKLFDGFKDISWGCSLSDIDWKEEGIESAKLEYLVYKYGFFYEGHRATIDCQVGIHLLSQKLPVSEESVIKRLLDAVRRVDVRLWAVNSPFDKKDALKGRGYYWSRGDDGKPKAWFIDIPEEDLANEKAYLNENIYSRPVIDLPVTRINAKVRFSGRV